MGKIAQKFKKFEMIIASHPRLKISFEWGYIFIMVFLSALSYALAFRLFIAPSNLPVDQIPFVGGGVSGLSQNFVKFIYDILGIHIVKPQVLQSITYFIFNIPVFILGWKKIGKQFTIFSIINVALASLFISLIPISWENAVIYDTQLTRTLFAGVLAGFSAAIAFKANVSSGGMDIVAYYFANRKSESVGKYAVSFNALIVGLYFVLNMIKPTNSGSDPGAPTALAIAITSFISSIMYLVMSAFVIDLINVRNKKSQLQIITNEEKLAKILIANFPHGATIVDGVGAYSNIPKTIIYMTVSSNEVNDVVRLVQEVDPKAFINVLELRQVFGKFYIKPIK